MMTDLEEETFRMMRQEMRMRCVDAAVQACAENGDTGTAQVLAAARKFFEWVAEEA